MFNKIYEYFKDKPKARKTINILSIIIIGYIIFSLLISQGFNTEKITYSDFLNMIDAGSITDVEITGDVITAKSVNSNKKFVLNTMDDPGLVDRLSKANIKFNNNKVQPNLLTAFFGIIINIILPLILVFFIFKTLKGGFDTKFNFKKKSDENSGIETITDLTFADVAGQEEAKEQLKEIVSFLHEPEKYKEIGAKIPKGALLVGPPGTGKTLLAKAVAGESHVPFLSISGSDFVELYVGMGARKVRQMFATARENAPCIIFIDEVDSIAKSRNPSNRIGNDEREQTLNQLLSEMDGFEPYSGIVILAATNRPEALDKAFIRPGRFDRKITINLPDATERLEILEVHTKDKKLGNDVDLKKISENTVGATGADLANIVNEAAIRAVKCGRSLIEQEDLEYAFEFLLAGMEKKNKILSENERKLVAYHELGHAIVSAILMNDSPVKKITIVPRSNGALGYTLNSPNEDEYLVDKNRMLAEITCLLGGRASEEVICNKITTGASNDIERATDIARRMVTVYGMSEIGPMNIETNANEFLGSELTSKSSGELSDKVNTLAQNIISQSYNQAKQIIKENKKILNIIAAELLEKETISGERFDELFLLYKNDNNKNIDNNINKEYQEKSIENNNENIDKIDNNKLEEFDNKNKKESNKDIEQKNLNNDIKNKKLDNNISQNKENDYPIKNKINKSIEQKNNSLNNKKNAKYNNKKSNNFQQKNKEKKQSLQSEVKNSKILSSFFEEQKNETKKIKIDNKNIDKYADLKSDIINKNKKISKKETSSKTNEMSQNNNEITEDMF